MPVARIRPAGDPTLAPQLVLALDGGLFICHHVRGADQAKPREDDRHRDDEVVEQMWGHRRIIPASGREQRSVCTHGGTAAGLPLLDVFLQPPVRGSGRRRGALPGIGVDQGAAHPPDGRVGEIAAQPDDRIGLDDHIGVGEDDDLRVGAIGELGHAHRLSGALGGADDRHQLGMLAKNLQRPVGGKIHIGHEADVRRDLLDPAQVLQLGGDRLLLIVGAEHQRRADGFGAGAQLDGTLGREPQQQRINDVGMQEQQKKDHCKHEARPGHTTSVRHARRGRRARLRERAHKSRNRAQSSIAPQLTNASREAPQRSIHA